MPVDPFEQLNTLFTDIAGAIRYHDGSSAAIKAVDFPRRISSSAPAGNATSLNKLFTDIADAIRYEMGSSGGAKNASTLTEWNTLFQEKTGYTLKQSTDLGYIVGQDARRIFIKAKDTSNKLYLVEIYAINSSYQGLTDKPVLGADIRIASNNGQIVLTSLMPSSVADYTFATRYELSNNQWGANPVAEMLSYNSAVTLNNITFYSTNWQEDIFDNVIQITPPKFSPANFPSLIRNL